MDESATLIQEKITEIISTGPGPELVGLLGIAADAGCPAWHFLDGVRPPRLYAGVLGEQPHISRRRLKPIVHEMIEGGSQRVFEIIDHGDATAKKQVQWLAAAVYRDLLGISERDTAELLGYAVGEYGEAKGLPEPLEKARLLWAELNAWPWRCYLPVGGALPDAWWRDVEVQRALASWCDARLPDPLPAARALASPAIYDRAPPPWTVR